MSTAIAGHSGEGSRVEYLYRRVLKSGQDNDETKLLRYSELLHQEGLAQAEAASEPDESLAAILYSLGEHDVVLTLHERFKGKAQGDMLPILAASIHFARNEPHKALAAAKYIKDIEARRLRQETAEIWTDLHAPLEQEPRVHLLILTHNRERYVAEALRQLAMTRYDNYAVFIADNGSGDATLARVREAVSFFPAHVPVSVQSFPVKIGRPAGHNWLLGSHDHSKAYYIAIGDDDLVRVPPDWLTRMIQTARAFPGCGCVGGKALTPGWPPSVHGSVHNHSVFGPDTITTSNTTEQPDRGQFDFVDMVHHVIGCLHIYDRAALDAAGHFDIRLSPCQFVDVEHHLRLTLAGYTIIFNGLIAFEHLRAMGAKARTDRGLEGNSRGNLIKVLSKHDHNTMRAALFKQRKERNAWLLS